MGAKAVERVKGLFGKAKEVATAEETKEAVVSNLNKAKNWVTKNLESSKDVISEAIEKAKTEGKSAKEVIKDLRLGKKIKGATKQVYDAIEKFATDRLADKGDKAWAEFIRDSIIIGKKGEVTKKAEEVTPTEEEVKKKDKTKVVPKTDK